MTFSQPATKPTRETRLDGGVQAAVRPGAGFADSLEASFWRAYLDHIVTVEAGEPEAFAPIINWGMRLLQDDAQLRYTFSVSQVTLRRWAAAETTPGPMARDSIVRRMERIAQERVSAPR